MELTHAMQYFKKSPVDQTKIITSNSRTISFKFLWKFFLPYCYFFNEDIITKCAVEKRRSFMSTLKYIE